MYRRLLIVVDEDPVSRAAEQHLGLIVGQLASADQNARQSSGILRAP